MLPHNSKFLKYAQYITPSKKSKNGSLSAIGKLACTIGNVLKPSGICGSKTVEQWADYIKSQYQIYQSEEINLDENNIAIYWDSVGSMKDEQGNYRFMELAYMIKSCLCISHSYVVPERGFSLKKNLIENRTSLNNETIISLRLVKEQVLLNAGVTNTPITKQLLTCVSKSRGLYHKFLSDSETQKKTKKKEKLIV